MTATGFSMWIAVAVLAAATAGNAAAAEKQPDGLPVEHVKRLMQYQDALQKLDDSEQARGIYRSATLWGPNYPKLRVCFFEGSQALRDVVAKVASEWEAENNSIRFDFGKPGKRRTCNLDSDMQIRVSFSKEGYWSHIGQNSVIFAAQNEPSLNLEGFMDIAPGNLTKYAHSTIRHEFGHALGIDHEHQNPAGGCDNEYNWKRVYSYLQGPPNNWPKETIDWNLRQASGEDIQTTKFDRKSVMIYQFPADFYRKGAKSKCFVPDKNTRISGGDRSLIAIMYPADAASRLANFKANREKFAAIWKKGDEKATKGVMFDAVKAFFDSPGTKDAPAQED